MKNKKQFEQEINEKLKQGLKHGEGKIFIEHLANKYKIPTTTATVYFYEVKKKLSKKPTDSSEKEKPMVQAKPLEEEKKTYKVGDEVEFVVKGIVPYGVMGETKDGMKTLLHISRVKNEYITSLERYFKMGDTVKGEIQSITNEHEISVSTMGYPLPDYFEKKERPELKEIEKYLQPIIGDLSEVAKHEFEKVIEEKGVFQLTLALGKLSGTFKADLGLLLLEEIKKHWNDNL